MKQFFDPKLLSNHFVSCYLVNTFVTIMYLIVKNVFIREQEAKVLLSSLESKNCLRNHSSSSGCLRNNFRDFHFPCNFYIGNNLFYSFILSIKSMILNILKDYASLNILSLVTPHFSQ